MKRLFAILAVALLVAACGNGDKKPKSVEEQLYEYVAQMENYVKADDYEKAEGVYEAYEKWVESLNEAQMEELLIALDEVDERLYILDDVGSSYYGEDAEEDVEEVVVPMVYSNSYDGYLNVRAQPTTKSQVLGTLRNGPEGAVLLGVEGKWVKVRVNGIEGYVWAADTQSYPSDPVNISAASVIGEWVWCDENAHFDSCTIESNGNFCLSGYLSMETSGKWHLSGNNLVLKHSNGQTTVCGVTGRTLIINNREYAKN